MPNLLLISLEGFSASSRQMYPLLFSKILSRSVVHESLTSEDALNYIKIGWPNIILVSDPAIVDESNRDLLTATIDWVKHGCTLVFMGYFASTIQEPRLDAMFKEHLRLKWRAAEYTKHDVSLSRHIDGTMMRRASLVPEFYPKALYLSHVPISDAIYTGGSAKVAYAAFRRFGLGKLGYIGDVSFGEEPERLILAMCGLDRSEDSLETMEQ